MRKNSAGFTLTELLIVIVLSGIVLAAASDSFLGLVRQSRQQGRIAESSDGMIGLEMMRRDIEGAGYGLPWFVTDTNWNLLADYREAANNAAATVNPALFNDGDAAQINARAPRAMVSADDIGVNYSSTAGVGSDYLVIKGTSVGLNDTSVKWTTLSSGNAVRLWNVVKEDFTNAERIIVLSTPSAALNRTLIVAGSPANYYTQFATAGRAPFAPGEPASTHMIYGVDPDTNLRMPFNRADYYISTANVPQRCAPNTGVLVKALVNHGDGLMTVAPILDCVADFQVVYRIDSNAGGVINNQISANINLLTDTDANGFRDAAEIRAQIKEVRVYVLTHEGPRDNTYTHPAASITVGEFGLGRNFTLGANLNYRWKVYRITAKPLNLD